MDNEKPPGDPPSINNKTNGRFGKGNKHGKGRPKGSYNRIKTASQEAVLGGESPLAILLSFARNTQLAAPVRIAAASAAAPYIHSKQPAAPKLISCPFALAPPKSPDEAVAALALVASKVANNEIDFDSANAITMALKAYLDGYAGEAAVYQAALEARVRN